VKKILIFTGVIAGMLLSFHVRAEQSDGLNVVVTSADRQTQLMAMVLSVQTITKHNKEVNMVICGAAGDLVLKDTVTDPMPPMGKSPTMLLKHLIDSGASVQVCPLYLPSIGKEADALMDGITVAKPAMVAGNLLDNGYKNLSY
jgi:predicted peroxiredoxin